MKKIVFMVMALTILVSAAPVCAEEGKSNKYAQQTQAYKDSIIKWAESCSLARTNALNTYNAVRVEVGSVEWKEKASGYPILVMGIDMINASTVGVRLDNLYIEFHDAAGRELKSLSPSGVFKLASGERNRTFFRCDSMSFGRHDAARLTAGTISVRFKYNIIVDDIKFSHSQRLTPKGAPFLAPRPRDPFWLKADEINYIVGSAEMEAGVYDQNVRFPERGWWPVPGVDGRFASETPGPMAKTEPVVTEYPSYLNKNGQDTLAEEEEDGFSLEDGVDAAKTAGDTAKTIKNVADTLKGLGSIF